MISLKSADNFHGMFICVCLFVYVYLCIFFTWIIINMYTLHTQLSGGQNCAKPVINMNARAADWCLTDCWWIIQLTLREVAATGKIKVLCQEGYAPAITGACIIFNISNKNFNNSLEHFIWITLHWKEWMWQRWSRSRENVKKSLSASIKRKVPINTPLARINPGNIIHAGTVM